MLGKEFGPAVVAGLILELTAKFVFVVAVEAKEGAACFTVMVVPDGI